MREEDELAADSVMSFAGLDGELPDNVPGWAPCSAGARRFAGA